MLVPLLSSSDTETITAAVASLRNLSIHKGNEVCTPVCMCVLCVCVCVCVRVCCPGTAGLSMYNVEDVISFMMYV